MNTEANYVNGDTRSAPRPDWLVDDLAWFDENWRRRFRLRPFVPGELAYTGLRNRPVSRAEELWAEQRALAEEAELMRCAEATGRRLMTIVKKYAGDVQHRWFPMMPPAVEPRHEDFGDSELEILAKEGWLPIPPINPYLGEG